MRESAGGGEDGAELVCGDALQFGKTLCIAVGGDSGEGLAIGLAGAEGAQEEMAGGGVEVGACLVSPEGGSVGLEGGAVGAAFGEDVGAEEGRACGREGRTGLRPKAFGDDVGGGVDGAAKGGRGGNVAGGAEEAGGGEEGKAVGAGGENSVGLSGVFAGAGGVEAEADGGGGVRGTRSTAPPMADEP